MGVPGRLSGRGDDGELRLKGKAVRPEEAGVLVVGGGLLLALLCCALIGCKIDCGGGRGRSRKGYRLPEDDEDEPLHAQADLFQYVCAGLLFAGLVGYAAYLNHSEGTAALCAKAGLQDAHGALAEKLCRGGKLHVSGDELLAFFNGSALALQ